MNEGNDRMGQCKKICLQYAAKKPTNSGRYDAGQKRCQICEIYITIEGTKDEIGLFCKCCNYRVRGKPRNRKYKEILRNSQNSTSEDIENTDDHLLDKELPDKQNTNISEINPVDRISDEVSTTHINKKINQPVKTFYEFNNFLENDLRPQANYQFVMLHELLSYGTLHKGEIAESLAYFNNKNTTDIDQVKFYFNVPVYDVLINHGFVIKDNSSQFDITLPHYSLNVKLEDMQRIRLLEYLSNQIIKYNQEHNIPDNQCSESNNMDNFYWEHEYSKLISKVKEPDKKSTEDTSSLKKISSIVRKIQPIPLKWMWSVTPENWEILKSQNIWGSRISKLQIGDRIKSGDQVAFYVIGSSSFKGIFEFVGDWYDSPGPIWDGDLRPNGFLVYVSQIQIKPVQLGSVKIHTLYNKMEIFIGKSQSAQNLVLQGGKGYPSNNSKPLSEDDFTTIRTELMQKQDELSENTSPIELKIENESIPIFVKTCPKCNETQVTSNLKQEFEEKIEKSFGYRQRNPNDPDSKITQSYCKQCRSTKNTSPHPTDQKHDEVITSTDIAIQEEKATGINDNDNEKVKEFNKILDALNKATDSIHTQIDNRDFLKLITKSNQKYPLMYLPDLLKDFIKGEPIASILDKHHLMNYAQISNFITHDLKFKLNQRRSLINFHSNEEKQNQIKKLNLENQNIAPRYYELTKLCENNMDVINSNFIYNLIRAYVILLFFIESQTIKHDKISSMLPIIIEKYSHLVRSKAIFDSNLKNYITDQMVDEIINDLIINEYVLPNTSDPKTYTISPLYLNIPSVIKNIIIKNKNGISYGRLFHEIHSKRTLFDLIPKTGIIINSIQLLQEQKEIIQKQGLDHQEDQFFIPSKYEIENLRLEQSIIQQGKQKFFGRQITPEKFISELHQLEQGDFEPQDDQVTRIAGMVLSNSNILKMRNHTPPLFDFSIDMSNYEFTSEQLQVLQETKIQLSSNIIHISIMINDELEFNQIEDMIREIPKNEQGLIICFKKIDDQNIDNFLQENKIMQIVDESNFLKWCEITPIIPCRLGSIAKIRYGDNVGQFAQINSINYESGLAEIIVFPSGIETTQYIGSMEEITFSNVDKFREKSNSYYYFLKLLFDISYDDEFKNAILESDYSMNVNTEVSFQKISCTFDKYKAQIDVSDSFLPSCNCPIWKEFSQTRGLCSHLIFACDLWFKQLIDNEERKITKKILHNLFIIKKDKII